MLIKLRTANYDTLDSDDEMGYVGFTMNEYTSGNNPYPSTITLTQNNMTIILNPTWC